VRQPQQVETAGAGFVADGQAVRTAQAADGAPDGALGRLNPLELRLPDRGRQHRSHNRELMHIQGDPQAHIRGAVELTSGKGRSAIRTRLWPKRPDDRRDGNPATAASADGQPTSAPVLD